MSAKTSTQPGRRTPLSLSGTVTKGHHPNKTGANAVNGSSNNANGHATSSTNKQDNKLQQQKNDQGISNNSEPKDNPNKRQQPQTEKKPQQSDNKKPNEKNQNAINSNKQQQPNENKQQHQNGNGDNKLIEKEKKEKLEKSDKINKPNEKSENEDTKSKEENTVEKDKIGNEKEDKKTKVAKEDKKDGTTKSDVKTEQQTQEGDKKSKEEKQLKCVVKSPEEKIEVKDVKEVPNLQQKSSSNLGTPKSNSKTNRTPTPVNKTPTKTTEKTPQKLNPTNTEKVTPVKKREETTVIVDDNDVEMEPLAVESSPVKSSKTVEIPNINTAPAATSTPGKMQVPKRNTGVGKSDVLLAMQSGLSPERPRTFSQISGRKSIRPISDYTPSKFQSNLQFRESYRRINTELDVTNTSMNVTVGSEAPTNLSYSFFGRSRKRDRTPPHSQSDIGELQTDMETSPPKKARLDMYGFLSAVSSPITLLRNRFSKTSLQSSTPVKLQQKINTAEDEIEVQNVSGVSMHEEIAKSDECVEETTTVEDKNYSTLGEEAKEGNLKEDVTSSIQIDSDGKSASFEKTCDKAQTAEQSNINTADNLLQPAIGDPLVKNKKCIVM